MNEKDPSFSLDSERIYREYSGSIPVSMQVGVYYVEEQSESDSDVNPGVLRDNIATNEASVVVEDTQFLLEDKTDNIGAIFTEPVSEDYLKSYLTTIGGVNVLTAAQEKILGRKVQKGIKAKETISELSPDELETEEGQTAISIVIDGEEAKRQFIEANLKLVVSIAKRYPKYPSIGLIDLLQEGNIALMDAVDKFNPEKGFKFSTYASWWIKQGISRAVSNQSRNVRLPVHYHEKIKSLNTTERELTFEIGREPTDEELADRLGQTVDYIRDLKFNARSELSLNTPTSDEKDGKELIDIFRDETHESPEDNILKLSDILSVNELLDELDARSRFILTNAFGLDGQEVMNMKDISDRLKINPETVRVIKNRALEKLRNLILENNLD